MVKKDGFGSWNLDPYGMIPDYAPMAPKDRGGSPWRWREGSVPGLSNDLYMEGVL